jgi:2-amino-4-hydroxy-6-hydroxymethyldihydropteridine diphosphokinase
MNVAYLLIGGNMGDRLKYLSQARDKIEKTCGNVINASSVYETEAWGMREQNSFYNQALIVHTSFDALTFLQCLLNIESFIGRVREEKYGPRLIDIDIIFFNDDITRSEELTVPHPELQNRRFVLLPLNEIAPEKMHPVFKKTIKNLLEECEDKLEVVKLK